MSNELTLAEIAQRKQAQRLKAVLRAMEIKHLNRLNRAGLLPPPDYERIAEALLKCGIIGATL